MAMSFVQLFPHLFFFPKAYCLNYSDGRVFSYFFILSYCLLILLAGYDLHTSSSSDYIKKVYFYVVVGNNKQREHGYEIKVNLYLDFHANKINLFTFLSLHVIFYKLTSVIKFCKNQNWTTFQYI